MILWQYCETAAPKTLQENICSSHWIKWHGYSLQLTTGLKLLLQRLYYKCSKGKGCSKILKTPKKLCKAISSSLTLQAWSLGFLASTKQTQWKKFPLVFWNSSLFYTNITASVTKSSHQDRGPCYLHLLIFFWYLHSSLLEENKVVMIAVFLSKLDPSPLFNHILQDYSRKDWFQYD